MGAATRMTTPMVQTTVPGGADTTVNPPLRPPSLALVILHSTSQPHRVGEVALLPPFKRRLLGRGDEDISLFLRFARHLPGQTPAEDPREDPLLGQSLSRRQAELHVGATDMQIRRVRGCAMLVNGAPCEHATLKPGDTVLFKGELLLLCTWR